MKPQDYTSIIESWKKAKFPARPSPEEMILFDALMSSYKGKKLLILGATPEFRDLGQKYNCEVTCVDINKGMLQGMKKLMRFSPEINLADSEILVESNWLHMPFDDNSFDIIFAEQSINIIALEDFAPFLQEVRRVLIKDGTFILKTIHYYDLAHEDILKQWKEEKRDTAWLYDRLTNTASSTKNGVASHKAVGEYFDELYSLDIIDEDTHNDFFDMYGAIVDADLHLHSMTREMFAVLLQDYFSIGKELYGEDKEKHICHPIYVLKPR